MSTDQEGLIITLEAGADLSAKQFFFAAVASDGQVDPAGLGVQSDGVLQNKPDTAGQAAALMINGVSKVVAGGAIARGALVMSAADGRAVVATGSKVLGRALEAAAAAGEVISVLLGSAGDTGTVLLTAGADLSAKQFLFMAVASDGKIDPAGDGVHGCGVLQNTPAADGALAETVVAGLSSVISGGTLATIGIAITSDSNGKAKLAATADIVQGILLEAAGGADETVAALITANGNVVA
jgi:hypothetical protein